MTNSIILTCLIGLSYICQLWIHGIHVKVFVSKIQLQMSQHVLFCRHKKINSVMSIILVCAENSVIQFVTHFSLRSGCWSVIYQGFSVTWLALPCLWVRTCPCYVNLALSPWKMHDIPATFLSVSKSFEPFLSYYQTFSGRSDVKS